MMKKINEKCLTQTGQTVMMMTLEQQSVAAHGELLIETATPVRIMSGIHKSIVLLKIRNTQILAVKMQMKCRLHHVTHMNIIVKKYLLEL